MTTPHATAAQIAQVMGVPKSTVIRRAEREAWAFQEEPGRGGTRRLYSVDSLPAAARAALAWRQPATVVPGTDPDVARAQVAAAGQVEGARLALRGGLQQRAAQARQQASLRQAAELAPAGQARMDARLAVVRACETFTRASGLPAHQARIAFALAYNDGSIDVPPTVRTEVATTSDTSIERWQGLLKKYGITALAGSYGNRAGSGRIDAQPAVQEFIKAMLVTFPHTRATQVLKALQARFAGPDAVHKATLPSLRSVERWMGEFREQNHQLLTALANPDEWKNKYMVAHGRLDEQVFAMNDLWQRDSSPADLQCTDGRYTLIGGIDVYTRAALLLVSKTSKSTAVAAHLRGMLMVYGVPKADKTDNGSDYTSRQTERIYVGLDIDHQTCEPFSPWQKGHIERFFGTFTRDLVELHPAYSGHSVADANALRARRSFADRLMKKGEVVEVPMSGAELQTFCDEWVSNVYMHKPHDGLDGRTPFEMVAAATDIRRIKDERALDVLLAEAPGKGTAIVQKRGIHTDGAWFIAPELGAWAKCQVELRYDPFDHDLGTLLVFGQAAGEAAPQYICHAYCPERTGVSRKDIAVRARAIQKELIQTGRAILRKASRKVGVGRIHEEILRSAKASAGKVTPLNTARAAQEHISAGLAAAADAARAALAPQRTTADLVGLELAQASIVARQQADAAQVPIGTPNPLSVARIQRAGGLVETRRFESPAARALWILQQALVRELSGEERESLAAFKADQPASYRRMQDMAAEQGRAMRKEEPHPGIAGQGGAV